MEIKNHNEWIEYQIWDPKNYTPFETDHTYLLYFPTDKIDITEIQEAISMVDPLIVVAYEGDTFEQASMNAHIVRNDSEYHTGIVMSGIHSELVTQIKWTVLQGLGPVVLRPNNFYGNYKAQPKELWQFQQQGLWEAEGWYHLATGMSHELDLPGRWTVGGDFVGARQQGTPSVCE